MSYGGPPGMATTTLVGSIRHFGIVFFLGVIRGIDGTPMLWQLNAGSPM